MIIVTMYEKLLTILIKKKVLIKHKNTTTIMTILENKSRGPQLF